MNHSIRTGQYPLRLKLGQVTPLFKKDDELNKSNYRPVTVLPALNNVFERLLSAQMGDFYQNILSGYISAYRRHHSYPFKKATVDGIFESQTRRYQFFLSTTHSFFSI